LKQILRQKDSRIPLKKESKPQRYQGPVAAEGQSLERAASLGALGSGVRSQLDRVESQLGPLDSGDDYPEGTPIGPDGQPVSEYTQLAQQKQREGRVSYVAGDSELEKRLVKFLDPVFYDIFIK
jgi:hypothetical protein